MSESAGGFADLRFVDDVATAFCDLLRTDLDRAVSSQSVGANTPYRLACSGGESGRRCFSRLSEQQIRFDALACYLVDERCVDRDSPDSNAKMLTEVLATRHQLAGFYPMDCALGPKAYDALLAASGPFDLVQLGFGPDGHVASLFPGSPALDAPPGTLVSFNVDPSGRNPHRRMTLTFESILAARQIIVVVMGEEKADALANVANGADLPAARLLARATFLCDSGLRGALPPSLGR